MPTQETISVPDDVTSPISSSLKTLDSGSAPETAGKRPRLTVKDPGLKLAHQRRSVLELAESLGNVSRACRQAGMDRTSFYEFRRRFQTHGLEGLLDLPPVYHTHPQTTAPEVVERILTVSLEHPAWGCVRLSDHLKLEGIRVSSPTIQNILIKHGMASRYDRLLRLENQAAEHAITLNLIRFSGRVNKRK
jgi:hypothetical protein